MSASMDLNDAAGGSGNGRGRADDDDSGPPGFSRPFTEEMIPLNNKGPALVVGIWLLIMLATVFITTRMYCKIKRHRKLHTDDTVLIISWIALVGSGVCNTIDVALFGMGKHVQAIHGVDFTKTIIMGNLSITMTVLSLAASKTSWALTLARITSGKMQIFIWFAIATINMLFMSTALLYWFQCWPMFTPHCLDPRVGMYLSAGTSAYSGSLDLIFAILPWRILRSLEASRKDKLGAAFSMSMGAFAALAAFLKCATFPELLSPDFTYDSATLNFTGFLEMAVTIMAASTPMMWVLLRMNSKKKEQEEHDLS